MGHNHLISSQDCAPKDETHELTAAPAEFKSSEKAGSILQKKRGRHPAGGNLSPGLQDASIRQCSCFKQALPNQPTV